jgi:hypothetical protein
MVDLDRHHNGIRMPHGSRNDLIPPCGMWIINTLPPQRSLKYVLIFNLEVIRYENKCWLDRTRIHCSLHGVHRNLRLKPKTEQQKSPKKITEIGGKLRNEGADAQHPGNQNSSQGPSCASNPGQKDPNASK